MMVLYLISDFSQLAFQTCLSLISLRALVLADVLNQHICQWYFLNEANKLKIKMSIGIIQHISSHEGATSFATQLYRTMCQQC